MARYEVLTVTNLEAENLGFAGNTPVGQAAHITDGSDAATTQAAVNAVLVVLEDIGFVASA